jgi:cation transport regulator ChaC
MDAETISAVAPEHRCLGVARLPEHRLAFTRRSIRTGTGVADVVAHAGAGVWGVLYELEQHGLDALDRKEGYDWAYVREPMRVHSTDGVTVQALVYSVRDKEPHEIRPSVEYAERLVQAARARGLDPGYVAQLLTATTPDRFGIRSP